ncbi:hypothetical protein D9M68_711120 [compost metagenome]
MVQDLQQIKADPGLVVVDVAGGKYGHLARRLRTIDHVGRHGLRRAGAEFFRRQLGQPGVFVHPGHAFHDAAHGLGLVHRVGHLHHDGNARELAVHVGGGQETLGQLDLTLLELDGLGAQHGVRKVQVPFVRRRVRALGHVAEVAHVALVDHLPVVGLGDAVHLLGRTLVDQIEQGGKGAAQTHAAPATVADVEDAFQLDEALLLVVEVGVLPVQRVPGGRLQVAFGGHARSSSVRV